MAWFGARSGMSASLRLLLRGGLTLAVLLVAVAAWAVPGRARGQRGQGGQGRLLGGARQDSFATS